MTPPMSDHDTWNMFAAASYAAWLAGGDYAAEECRTRAVADADWFVIESKKREPANLVPEGPVYAAAEPIPPQTDDDGGLAKALWEARTELMIAADNARDAAKTDRRWVGVAEKLTERVAACDRALSEAGVTI